MMQILKFINSKRCKQSKDVGSICGSITLSKNSYEVFRVLSYEYISDPEEEVLTRGLPLAYIRMISGLSDDQCRDCFENLKAVGLVYEILPERYVVSALGKRTNTYQEEGKRHLAELDKLMDEWEEEQKAIRDRGVYREDL